MIIPSIDLMGGQAVQLRQGKELAIEAGDPRPILERFRLAGEIAVIDLDAAMGQGSNRELIEELVRMAPCRVGGGVRTAEDAIRWLDAGAEKVILGTAATPEILRELPRRRIIAALDARDGEVVVEGWKRRTGRSVVDRIAELREHVAGFLVTLVETEGMLAGIDLERIKPIVEAAGDARLTAAGGVTTAEEIAALDRLAADAQVGMAIYTGRLDLGDAIAAPLVSDRPDELWPTVVVNEMNEALGLVYSSAESLREAIRERRGVYHSRSRGLWVKGQTSGDIQELRRIDLDCDRDALRFVVRQKGRGFCHLHQDTCWGDLAGLAALERTITARLADAPEGSYTKRLLEDPALLRAKLQEEAGELAEAEDVDDVRHEAADLLYFAMTRMAAAGVSLADVASELDRRARKVTRRPGDAKPTSTGTSKP